jgi:hypothetical protein
MFKVAVLGILLASLTAHASGSSPKPPARFQGVLLDVTDARIVGATLTIVSRTRKITFQSNEEGLFDLEVPPGFYQLVVEALGFERFQIKRLEVKKEGVKGMTIHLNVDRDYVGPPIYEPPGESRIEPEKAPVIEPIKPRKIQ